MAGTPNWEYRMKKLVITQVAFAAVSWLAGFFDFVGWCGFFKMWMCPAA